MSSSPRRGFTLIELLLYVGLSSLLLLIFSMFLAMLLSARVKNQAIAEVDQQGLFVMRVVTQAVRNAESVTSPAPGASAAALVLQTSSAPTDPTGFDLNASSSFRIAEGAAAPVPLTNARVTVSDLTFQNVTRTNAPGAVRIQFTLTHINPSNKNEYRVRKTFTTTATVR